MRILAVLFVSCFCASALAQEGMPAPIAASAEHEVLKGMVGKWTTEMSMTLPDGTVSKSAGTQVATLVLGGLGLSFDFEGQMGPAKMLGHGLITWIPGKGKYQSTWMDNMSTHGLSIGWATYDAATKTYTEIMTGPGPDGKDMSMTISTVMASPDSHTSTFTMKGPDGKDFKMMEIAYTRAKG